jgi:peptidoglycan/LPS O-acetylase OafA/YrhL
MAAAAYAAAMEAHPPAMGSEPGAAEAGLGTMDAEPRALDPDPAVPPRPESIRDLIPWVTEIAFVTGLLLIGLIVFLVLTSGENPFATVLVPIVLALAVIAAVMRHSWIRRHRDDANFVHARHVARERRGF